MSVSVWSEWHGDVVAARVARKSPQASHRAAEQLLGATIPRTPKLTGALRSSGHVVDTTGDSSAVVFDAAYAVIVHELMRLRHPVGEAKFLQNALEDERDELLRTMADEIGEAFK